MTKAAWNDLLGWSKDQLHTYRCNGYSYLKQGKYDAARIYFEALLLLQPGHHYDLKTLGAVYLFLGDAKRAIATIDKALALDPHDWGSRLNRAKALFLLGDRAAGIRAAQALTLCPIRPIADDASALVLAYQ